MSKNTVSITVPTVTLPWFTLWIFTIAFAHLGFWSGCAALVIWPYYLGDVVATLLRVR